MTRIILVILFATFVQWAYSARILTVIPSPSYSHQIFFRPLWRELADRGHDLVVITTDPTNDNYPNIKEISTKETYIPMKQIINMMVNSSVFDILLKNKWRDLSLDLYYTFFNIPAIQELINNKTEHFDLLIIEHYMSPMFGFKHRFNCSMIGVSSMDSLPLSHSVMGNPTHSVLYPASMFPYQENLSFLERLAVVVFGNIFNYLINNILGDLNQIGRDNFGQDMPSLQDIFEDTDMLFVNANPVFNAVRPHTPSTISIAGGMHISVPKPLPEVILVILNLI
ncbi:UDP-glycosyltransferase UGT4-like [Atheta coriaria]|uniref:UDP-glycosyltransferase UGT4-like n=1 Tax=Dalotia coriaria TaxID=877792 RepID=UPI0031F3FBE3